MPIIESYLDDLIKNSTLDVTAWNIEAARKGGKSGWNYIDGCMILAMIETWKITGEKKYLDFAEAYIDHRVQEDGTIKGYNPDDYNIDNVNAGKTLFLLYDITGKEKYRKAIDVIYGQLKGQPRTSEGNFWHKKIYPNQVWLDGMYMVEPFYMRYETEFNGKKNYYDIYKHFTNVRENMFNEDKQLHYHGWDTAKKLEWADKQTGLSKNFWLRAIGWHLMAMVDTLE